MKEGCFVDHCAKKHDWMIFPCSYDNCKFEAYSAHCFKLHRNSHMYENKEKLLPLLCDRENCSKRFAKPSLLKIHLKGHDNNLLMCSFCQWGGVEGKQYVTHMNNHFRHKPYKCEKCSDLEIKFYTRNNLERHIEAVHEKDIEKYSCDICDYKTYSDQNLHTHRKTKHFK
jgi:hypothetical protein